MNTGERQAISLILRRRSSRIQKNIDKRQENDVQVEKRGKRLISNQISSDDNCDSKTEVKKRIKQEQQQQQQIRTTDCILDNGNHKAETTVGLVEDKVKQEIRLPDDRSHELYQPDGFINVDADELDLERTLLGGQSFRWTKWEQQDVDQRNPMKIFSGVVDEMALSLWRCDRARIGFKILSDNIRKEKESLSKVHHFFENYFQLKYKVQDLYKDWSSRDKNLEKCCEDYKGFRILRQHPVENVFSFICATNNNIKRISQMVDSMCKHFGEKLGTIGNYHKFPTIERLAQDDVEDCLRNKLSFGYRAKYICGTAKKLLELSRESQHKNQAASDILLSFRQLAYPETCKQLQHLPGIGRKVADCICLMSMDHLNAVPTDCHIYEIVCRNYIPALSHRKGNLNEQVHQQIGDYFNNLHGPLAGWSTSVLFIAELKHLKMNNGDKKKKKKRSLLF